MMSGSDAVDKGQDAMKRLHHRPPDCQLALRRAAAPLALRPRHQARLAGGWASFGGPEEEVDERAVRGRHILGLLARRGQFDTL